MRIFRSTFDRLRQKPHRETNGNQKFLVRSRAADQFVEIRLAFFFNQKFSLHMQMQMPKSIGRLETKMIEIRIDETTQDR